MAFDHIDTWVFDLDNTLYNADTHAFPQMGARMTDFVARFLNLPHDQANAVRRDYFHRYGTTLRGLMTEHGIAPEEFLSYVHDFDIAPIDRCAITQNSLKAMHGRKIVFTNAPRAYAVRVIDHLGIAPHIDGVFAVEDADHWPKPMEKTYDVFLKAFDVTPQRACMVEDMDVNLVPAHARGMTTVWLHCDNNPVDYAHVHHRARRIDDFFNTDYFTKLRKAAP